MVQYLMFYFRDVLPLKLILQSLMSPYFLKNFFFRSFSISPVNKNDGPACFHKQNERTIISDIITYLADQHNRKSFDSFDPRNPFTDLR